MLKLVKLQTEFQDRATIETLSPQFSWRYGEYKGSQKSYHILVASEKQLLSSPDMWDSGEVESSVSHATYCGKPFKSNSVYYVKCLLKDVLGNSYEAETTFETALLCDEDWKGQWVSLPDAYNGGSLRFRKNIEIPNGKNIVRAKAFICGIGYHEFYINGKKIGTAVLNPSVTEYSKRVEYCAYDMEGLTQGTNVVGIELGYGWFGARKLNCQFNIELSDGTMIEDHTCPGGGWWVGGSPIKENGIYSGETYDARIEETYPLNWCTADYEPTWANYWMYTIYTPAPSGKLTLQTIEPIRVCGSFPEKSRKKMPNGDLVLDMGQNLAGWARIKVSGERGAKVNLRFAEDLKEDGYINQLNLRSARCSDTYILRGEGIEEYAPKFTYHGFRYIQVSIEGKAELISCTAEHVHTDTRVVGSFNCSDATINELHRIAVITEQNNEHSILTDCPQRDERFGWLNDLGSRIFQTVYNIDMSRFFPKFIRDITHTQGKNGEIADTAPYYTGGIPADPVCVIYPLIATLAYRLYGDKNTVIAEYENVRKWVDYLLSRSENYIMDYAYYADWVAPFSDIWEEPIYVSSAYLYWHLKEMKNLASIVGNVEDEKKYADHLEKAKKALNDKYFDAKTYNYSKGTQTGNALALAIGFADERYAKEIAKNIYDDVVKNNHHITSGNVGYKHVFYMLAEYGYIDETINVLKNPEYPGWGYMIASGATTVWERWESEMQNIMHSFDHPMFGSYDAMLYKYVGGISVDDDAIASDKMTFNPKFPSQLDYAESSLETVNGVAKCSWKRDGDKIVINITVPPQTTAKAVIGDKTTAITAGEYEFTL